MANEHRWSDHGRGWSGDRGRYAGESRGSQGDAWRDDMTDDERGWRGSEAGREGYGQDYRSEPGGGYGREPRREGYGREGYGREGYGREGYGPEGYGREAMRREGYGGGYGGQEGYRAGGYGGGGGYGEGPERYGRQGYGRPGGQGRQGGAYGGEHGGSRYGSDYGGEHGRSGPGHGDIGRSGYGGYGGGHEAGGGHGGHEGGRYARESYERSGGERGLWDRARDEVSSWFGDEEAGRRRRIDEVGQHRGRGPRGYQRSDDRIREDVNDRLTDDPMLDASGIEVTVAKCEVTLNGTVDSRADKRRAEDVAEHVSGVSHVQNNLRVRQGAGSQWTGGAAGTVPSAGASGTTASTVRSTAASPGATGASGGSGMGGPSSSTPGGETPQRH